MLQTDDIGKFFAIMQANYGHRWAHKADAIPVWQEKLRSWNPDDLMRVADKAIDAYPDFPPTIGQIAELQRQANGLHRPQSTYLPAPHTSEAMATANKIMLTVIKNNLGVDSNCLECLKDLKAAMVAEHKGPVTLEFIDAVTEAMTEVAENHDKETKAQERELYRPKAVRTLR